MLELQPKLSLPTLVVHEVEGADKVKERPCVFGNLPSIGCGHRWVGIGPHQGQQQNGGEAVVAVVAYDKPARIANLARALPLGAAPGVELRFREELVPLAQTQSRGFFWGSQARDTRRSPRPTRQLVVFVVILAVA